MLIRMLKQNFSYLDIKKKKRKTKQTTPLNFQVKKKKKQKHIKIYITGIPLFLEFHSGFFFFYKLKVDGTIYCSGY